MHIFKNTDYNFLRWRWHAVALSWVVIIAGLVVIYTKAFRSASIRRRDVDVTQLTSRSPSNEVRSALDRSFKESVISPRQPAQHRCSSGCRRRRRSGRR
jgi:hypothetical protein